ncbi:hypothetical protein FACS189499_03730 [Clostridia bacterium]|nr:hypothetical protein FACS189499_03730 [Clostridia bacterium]
MDYEKLSNLSNDCNKLRQFIERDFDGVRKITVIRNRREHEYSSASNVEAIELYLKYSAEFSRGLKKLLGEEFARLTAEIEEVMGK